MFRKVFFVILLLSILIIFGGFKSNKNKFFIVTGKALVLKNSQKSKIQNHNMFQESNMKHKNISKTTNL